MVSGPITSWQLDAEKVEAVADFLLLGSKITVDGDCSRETKRCLLLGRKAMTILAVYLIAKTSVCQQKSTVKAIFFLVVIYGCESQTIKKAEFLTIDAFELWYWKRLSKVPWTAMRSNQSILKEINPGYSLEGLLWPPDAKNKFIGKDLDAGKD